jgi:hypothetical protein
MKLIEGIALSNLCDYSFGDQSGQWGNIYTSFMKDANLTNVEFVSKLFETKKSRDYMTLFIDNIRLYKRHIVEVSEVDRPYIDSLHQKNDLLHLCSCFPDMRFIIFTNLEDTPIDDYIFDCIPDNVLCISAVNGVSHGGKIIPAPYGIQRKMNPNDNRIDFLESYMKYAQPEKFQYLLYVSHNEESNLERKGIKDLFQNKPWAKVDMGRVDYSSFIGSLYQSKFMICPKGNASDCHRNWEVLYMRRVPVMKKHPYLEELFKDYPVLFVEKYSDIDENLLLSNEFLFDNMQQVDIKKLDLNEFYDRIVYNSLKRDD